MSEPQSAIDFLGMRPDAAGDVWLLPVEPPVLNLMGTLWGGCGLAGAVVAAEQTVGRPCVWATVQYVAPIRAGDEVAFRADVERHGTVLSQVSVTGTVGERAVLRASGTFGGDDGSYDLQFGAVPQQAPGGLRPPAESPGRTVMSPDEVVALRLLGRVEQRWAADGADDGRTLMWMRLLGPDAGAVEVSPASLAILADLAPVAVAAALHTPAFAVSLDNSLRVARVRPADWLLLDTQVEAVVGSIAQVSARIFDAGGHLLATAGQSAQVRRMRER